ncbi:hypothetical protein Tco_0574359 [Tanacetum coccineum]
MKAQENRVEMAGLRMLRWTCGKTMLDMIPNGGFKTVLEVETIMSKMREGREVPSFDEPKPQPQPLPNCPPLDVSLGNERGLKPHSSNSFRMKVIRGLGTEKGEKWPKIVPRLIYLVEVIIGLVKDQTSTARCKHYPLLSKRSFKGLWGVGVR